MPPQLWFELAGLLEGVGDFDTARVAYRSAAASTGLRSRPAIPTARDRGDPVTRHARSGLSVAEGQQHQLRVSFES